jgi:hypothetical protein
LLEAIFFSTDPPFSAIALSFASNTPHHGVHATHRCLAHNMPMP